MLKTTRTKSQPSAAPRAGKARVAPLSLSRVAKSTAPSVSSQSSGIRVRHTEFFSVASSNSKPVGSSTIVNTVFAWTIQPGWQTMFPWLSSIALRYEKYRIHSLAFEFIPRVPATTDGTICICLDQDPNDQLPSEDEAGRIVMMTHQGAVSAPIWTPIRMPYPASWIQAGERFVRSSGENTTVEPRTADMGVLFVGLFGVENLKVFGDLFVHYDVSFALPQMVQGMTDSNTTFYSVPEVSNNSVAFPLESIGSVLATLQVTGALADDLLFETGNSSALGTRLFMRYIGDRPMAGHLLTGFTGGLAHSESAGSVLDWLKVEVDTFARDNGQFQMTGAFPVELSAVNINATGICVDGLCDDFRINPGEAFLLRLIDPSSNLTSVQRVAGSFWNFFPTGLAGVSSRVPTRSYVPRTAMRLKVSQSRCTQESTDHEAASTSSQPLVPQRTQTRRAFV